MTGPAPDGDAPDHDAADRDAPDVVPGGASEPAYRERLVVPAGLWALVLVVALVVAATLHGGAGGARAVVPYLLVLPLTVVLLLFASRHEVVVADGVLAVPGARIGLSQIGGVTPLDRDGTRRLRGPLAQPRAFVAVRSWQSRSVRIQIEDPDDDTPYWLVGTRNPDALVAALHRG